MVFNQYPLNVACAGSDVIIGLSGCDPDRITEAHILSEGEILGIKRFRGSESYKVNVACYLQDTREVTPYYSATFCGYRDMPSRINTFYIRAVQYDAGEPIPPSSGGWIQTEDIKYTAGKEPCRPWDFLMEMEGDLEMCPGDNMELPILIPEGRLWSRLKITGPGWSTYMSPNYSGDEHDRLFSYFINTTYIENAIEYKLDDSIELEITLGAYDTDYEVVKRIAIREMPQKGIRLCWVNKFGTTDYFTFSQVQSAISSASKTRIQGSEGLITAENEKEEILTVRTPFLSPEKLRQLTGIISSRKVWHIENGTLLPVDIITHKAAITTDKPGGMDISFRYC